MPKKRWFFPLLLLLLGISGWFIFVQGQKLEPPKIQTNIELHQVHPENSPVLEQPVNQNFLAVFLNSFKGNLQNPLSVFVLQLITIVLFARLFGVIFRRFGQPTVIGEIIAGIILGPSVFGLFFPSFSAFLFPVSSLINLQFLSQVGLILFMFIVGMDLDINIIRNKVKDAVIISQSGVVFPFLMGIGLSLYLFSNFAPANISFLSFTLFIGTAMSITAFPVLARIIHERKMTRTPLGVLAITCAAADDLVAWCLLAAVIAIVKAGTAINVIFTIGLLVAYVTFMLFAVRPFLQRVGSIFVTKENLSKTVVAFVFLIMLGSAFLTEIIGIHLLFGAFLAGVIMPKNIDFKKVLTEKIEDVSMVLFLPLFFVLTGLRTQIGLLNTMDLWMVCGLVILVAFVGKFGGVTIAARYMGQSWQNSLSLGALMNTRGLMELIVLNIGYELGVFTPSMFTMMVIMALATTFFTGPALSFINLCFTKKIIPGFTPDILKPFRILISFAQPKMGSSLLKLANFLADRENTSITALHITPSSELNYHGAIDYEEESFIPIKHTANELNINLETDYKATGMVSEEIHKTLRKGHFNLLLMGGAKNLFSGNVISGKIKNIIDHNPCNTAILLDKDLKKIENVFCLLDGENDSLFKDFCLKVNVNANAKISVFNINQSQLPDLILNDLPSSKFDFIANAELNKELFENFDLALISIESWKHFASRKASWLSYCPSTCIIRLV
jgi:Kef-type K+ transport system membrane component KefB